MIYNPQTSHPISDFQPETQQQNFPSTLDVTYPTDYVPNQRRFSVSSESYDPWEILLTRKSPSSTPKTPAERKQILQTLKKNTLFASLNEMQLEEVSSSMFKITLQAGETIIKQDDPGDDMYIIHEGQLEVLYSSEPVAVIGPGRAFGELALMYNCPRTATVRALTPASLWGLDRSNFRRILMEESIRKRARYESFLARVPIFEFLLPYERSRVADALDTEIFKSGSVIIQEGTRDTNGFYIIEKGSVVVTKIGESGAPPVEAMRLTVGDYFGELGLLSDRPRQATVIAADEVQCLVISRQHFDMVMGPAVHVLNRNIKKYETYEEIIRRNSSPKQETLRRENSNPSGILQNFVNDESGYVGHLNTIVNGYLEPIRSEKSLKITEPEIHVVFSNVEALLAMHRRFLASIEKISGSASTFSDIRAALIDLDLYLYKIFYENYYSSIVILHKCRSLPSFSHFLTRCEEASNGWSLDSLFKLLYSRPNQYISFLRNFSEKSEKDSEKKDLTEILKKLESAEENLTKVKKEAEIVYDVQTNLLFGEFENLVIPKRKLISKGYIEDGSGDRNFCFLFTDLLVISKPIEVKNGDVKYMYNAGIDLRKAFMIETDNGFCINFRGKDGKEKRFIGVCDKNNDWIQIIRKAIGNVGEDE